MKKINGYEETIPATGESVSLKPGAYVCRIISAKEESSRNGSDMLTIAFDIADGDYKDFYKRKFEVIQKYNASAKWPGVHRILFENKEGNCNPFFKGFTTSVEESNKSYKWDWNEETLKGKVFGAIFGREEYENDKGESAFSTKIRYIRSVDKLKEAEIPEDKLLEVKDTFITIDEDENLPF